MMTYFRLYVLTFVFDLTVLFVPYDYMTNER